MVIGQPPATLFGNEAKDADGAEVGNFGHHIALAVCRVGAALAPGEDDQFRRSVGHDVFDDGLYLRRAREHALIACRDGWAATNDARDRAPDLAPDLDEGIVCPDRPYEIQRPGVEGVRSM